jgi:hypothetical protein
LRLIVSRSDAHDPLAFDAAHSLKEMLAFYDEHYASEG